MRSAIAQRIEADIQRLPLVDQLWLMERLAQRIREQASPARSNIESHLAAMAEDPEIQRELHLINAEFAEIETDGLDEAA